MFSRNLNRFSSIFSTNHKDIVFSLLFFIVIYFFSFLDTPPLDFVYLTVFGKNNSLFNFVSSTWLKIRKPLTTDLILYTPSVNYTPPINHLNHVNNIGLDLQVHMGYRDPQLINLTPSRPWFSYVFSWGQRAFNFLTYSTFPSNSSSSNPLNPSNQTLSNPPSSSNNQQTIGAMEVKKYLYDILFLRIYLEKIL